MQSSAMTCNKNNKLWDVFVYIISRKEKCSESPVSLVSHFSSDSYLFPFTYQWFYLSAFTLNIYDQPITSPSRIDQVYGIIKRKNLHSDDAYLPDELTDWRPDGQASQEKITQWNGGKIGRRWAWSRERFSFTCGWIEFRVVSMCYLHSQLGPSKYLKERIIFLAMIV